jgi:hypothetical protein
MKRGLKFLAILLLILALGLGGLYGVFWCLFHHYWEAEPKVGPVWEVAYHIRDHLDQQQPLPSSLNELLAEIDPAQLAKIRDYPMIWQPDSDPVFVIRINEIHGFIIDREGKPSWLWKREQVSKHFPNY